VWRPITGEENDRTEKNNFCLRKIEQGGGDKSRRNFDNLRRELFSWTDVAKESGKQIRGEACGGGSEEGKSEAQEVPRALKS